MLRNFARKICGVDEKWDMGHFLKEQIKKIREQVGDGKVLCALSGGVDSSVVAALLYEAIGDQLIPVFVDNGLLRKGEREQVESVFKVHLKVPLITVDASEHFLVKLAGVTDPERKRKLLLQKRQIEKIRKKVDEKGLTLIPKNLYINSSGYAKITLAIAKGKKNYDKRNDLQKKTQLRDMERRVKNF